MRKRMLSEFDRSPKYFGWFTWKDLLRLGLPVTLLSWLSVGQSTLTMLGAGFVGVILGMVWAVVHPYGQPFEVYLYHRIRWIVFRSEK